MNPRTHTTLTLDRLQLRHRARGLVGLALFALLPAAAPAAAPSLPADLTAWRAARDERLRGPESWLTLVGLFWLEEGRNAIGSAPENRIVLPPHAPAHLGAIERTDRHLVFTAAPGVEVTSDGQGLQTGELSPDTAMKPSVLHQGPFTLLVIERGDRFGLRVKDAESATRKGFTGLDHFPYDPRWTITGRFVPAPAGQTLPVPNVLGKIEDTPSPGDVVFTAGGRELRLTAIAEEGTDELFLVFGDATNGHETYGGGRFLYAAKPGADGQVELDFHRAYNPPCAFTPFATCPLPPKSNRLPIRVEAGEKKYGKGHA